MDQQKQVITLDLLPPTQDDSQDQDYFIFRLRGSQPKPSFAMHPEWGGTVDPAHTRQFLRPTF